MTKQVNARASDAERPMPLREGATRTGRLNRRNFWLIAGTGFLGGIVASVAAHYLSWWVMIAVGIAVGGVLVLAVKWREHSRTASVGP